MGQALYRKYRPRKFSEAVGQDAVTKTLAEAIKSGRISHAYLFAGPRGVGKTSVARILAHEVNGLPYKEDSSHLDIIEIDAASNRRIDEIRDLREKVRVTPVAARYKVYIIDEVHMLTKEAFNALLKTLEEPPAHCIFILATTEPHKLPETIISRTQRFNFKPIDRESVKSRLQKLAAAEKITLEKEALNLLADHSDGSLRDIEGLLDQLNSSSSQITEKGVRNLLGVPPQSAIDSLASSLAAAEPRTSLAALESLKDLGADPVLAAKSLSQNLRQKYLDQQIVGGWLITLLQRLLEVADSSQPQESLELAILEAAGRAQNDDAKPPDTAGINGDRGKQPEQPQAQTPAPSAKTSRFEIRDWDELLARVRKEAPSLYTALRLAEPAIDGDRLRLAFPFPLHQKKVKEAKHLSIIGRLVEEVSGDRLPIDCVVNKQLREPAQLQAISNIFGSAEVLES